MKNKRSLISLFNIRIIALILAVVMIFTSIDLLAIFGDSLAFPTATAEETDGITDEVLAGSTIRDDALHFLIRHWHTELDYDTTLNGHDYRDEVTGEELTTADGRLLNDVMSDSIKNVQTEAASNSHFVLVEGYIIPRKTNSEITSYDFYLVNQTTQTLVNVFEVEEVEEDGETKTQFKTDANGNKIIASSYIGKVDEEKGWIQIKIKPLNEGGDDLEVFSGFSISTGRNAFTTNTNENGVVESITLQYDSLTHLAKGHVFYTEKREMVPGTSDPAVFTASKAEIDVATVYTYTDLGDEGIECLYHKNDSKQPVTHHNGDIVKYVPDSDDGESGEVACTNDESLLLAKEQCSAFDCHYEEDKDGKNTPKRKSDGSIEWYNVELTKFYSTNEGLHTDKTLMQAADGRIFLFDLQTWYTEGYAAQLSYILDASGSMLWAFDEPSVMNIYGILAEKLGAKKVMTSAAGTEGVNTTYNWTYTDNSGNKWTHPAGGDNLASWLKSLFEQILKDKGIVPSKATTVSYDTSGNVDYIKLANLLTENTGTTVTKDALEFLFGKIGVGSNNNWDNAFINDNLDILLNPRNTDNRSLGTNGYSYFVYSDEAINGMAYAPLAYWQGSEWRKEEKDSEKPYEFTIDKDRDIVGGWPNSHSDLKMGTADGINLMASSNGIVLDAQPTSGNFTLSFTLTTSTVTNPDQADAAKRKIKEILYIGSLNGNTADSNYYRLFRNGGDFSDWLLATSNSTSGDFVTSIGGVFPYNTVKTTVITLVFNGNTVTSYSNGNLVNTATDFRGFSLKQDEKINIVINGIKDDYTGMEIGIDNIYVINRVLSQNEIKNNFNSKKDSYTDNDLIGKYTFTNSNPKPDGTNGGNTRWWLWNEATNSQNNNPQFCDGNALGSFAYALAKQKDGSWRADFGINGNSYTYSGTKTVNYQSITVATTVDGTELGALRVGDSYTNIGGLGAGWYYISHAGAVEFYRAVQTGKQLYGVASSINSFSDAKGGSISYSPSSNSASLFYIDKDGNLRCFFASGNNNTGKASYVYQLEDSQYSRVEAAQRILANFSTSFSALSPTSYLSAVRFSSSDYNSSNSYEQILLDWSSDPTEAANIMSNMRGESNNQVGKALGYTTSLGGVNQYNYVLTGSTSTKAGLQAYAERLHGVDKNNKLDGHLLKDQDAPKFLIIFTDGADSDIKTSDPNNSSYKKITYTYEDESGKKVTASIWVLNETINLAKDLRNDGYTIVGVLFAGDAMGAEARARAQAFLSSIIGTKEHYNGSADFKLDDYFLRASELGKVITLFNEQILAQLVDSLTGYTIQDYIDPRFDLEQGNGTRWKLKANGQVVAEIPGAKLTKADVRSMAIGQALDEALGRNNWQLSYGPTEEDETEHVKVNKVIFTLPSGGVKFHVYDVQTDHKDKNLEGLTEDDLADITTDARDPYLCYDSSKDMYYLQWVDQTLPTSQVGAISMMPVWSVTILLHAKDDFIGGNAILTDGNDAYMNWVYHPLDLDVGDEDYDNLNAQQIRNLAEQEAYIEMRIQQYEQVYDTLTKGKNTPTITKEKYVQAHLAEYLWNNLGTLASLSEEQVNAIQGKVKSALIAKYNIISSYKNFTFPSALNVDEYVKRDQAQYLYEHLSEYLTDLTEEELANKIEDIEKAIQAELEKEFPGDEDEEINATPAEYVTLKLAENTSKKTDSDASSGTKDMLKIYYPETNDKGEYIDKGQKQIYVHHEDDGTFYVYRTAKKGDPGVIYVEGEGWIIKLDRSEYERDWNNPIDARISKGFPRATVNVQLLKIDVGSMYSVVYMGEVISPAQLLADIEGDIISDSYYLEYLKRYAYQRYLHNENLNGVDIPLLDLLNKWLQFNNDNEYKKSFSIPYMYLPGVKYGEDGTLIKDEDGEVIITNSSGFSTPEQKNKAFDENDGILADVVGILTYRWEQIEPHAEKELKDPAAATKNFVKTDTERLRYAVTVGFTPLREGDVLNGCYVKSDGEICTDTSEDHKHDNEEYIPGLNEYDDDGDPEGIFAGYLPIRGNDSSEKWDWGNDKSKYSEAANFVFDRKQLVNGYTDDEGAFHTGYIKETTTKVETSTDDEGNETQTVIPTGTIFKWDHQYKPSVYLQQLVNDPETYTHTDDTVNLINEGQRFTKDEKGEDVVTADENVPRKYAGDPRTIKGYSVYAINVVSGGITLEFKMLKGELKAMLNDDWVEPESTEEDISGVALNDEGDGDLTEDEEDTTPVVLNKTFKVEATRRFADTEFAERLKNEEHLSDYGDTFTITFTLKYTQKEIEKILKAAEDDAFGYVTVYAEATTVKGTWIERTVLKEDELSDARAEAQAKEEVEVVPYGEGDNTYYVKVEQQSKEIYEQLPIGSYTFTLSNLNELALEYNMQFSTIAPETDESKYKDAYDYFSDVVLNGLHTSNEVKDKDVEGKYIPTLAQRRYDDAADTENDKKGGKLVYVTDESTDPVPIVAAARGYVKGKDSDGNEAWLDGKNVIYHKVNDVWLDAKGNDLGYHYNQKLGVWLDANNERVPYYWTADQMKEITKDNVDDEGTDAEANGTKVISRSISNYIAGAYADTEEGKESVTFYMGTIGSNRVGSNSDSKNPASEKYYPGERVGIVRLATGTVKLTIHEEGGKSNESFLYRIEGKTLGEKDIDLIVSVKGCSKTTIEIVAGKYTVTEVPSQSWRYYDSVIDTAGQEDCALVKLKDKPIEYCGTYELIWVIEEDKDGKQSRTTEEVFYKVDGEINEKSNWTVVEAKEATEETPAALTYATIKLTTKTKEAVVTFTHARNGKTWVGGENYGNPLFPFPPQSSEQTGE